MLQLSYSECAEFCYTGNPLDAIDGTVRWNYSVTRLPEPSAIALVALTLAAIGLHKLQRRRAPEA